MFWKFSSLKKEQIFDFSNVEKYTPIAPGPPFREIISKPLDKIVRDKKVIEIQNGKIHFLKVTLDILFVLAQNRLKSR